MINIYKVELEGRFDSGETFKTSFQCPRDLGYYDTFDYRIGVLCNIAFQYYKMLKDRKARIERGEVVTLNLSMDDLVPLLDFSIIVKFKKDGGRYKRLSDSMRNVMKKQAKEHQKK